MDAHREQQERKEEKKKKKKKEKCGAWWAWQIDFNGARFRARIRKRSRSALWFISKGADR